MAEPRAAEARAALRAATGIAGLCAVGTLASLALWSALQPDVVKLWPWWLALGVEASGGVALWLVRERASALLVAYGVLLAVVGCIHLAGWETNDALARSDCDFEAFQAFKLSALLVALLGPPRAWIGVACIVSGGALAGIQYAHWPPGARAAVSAVEPWSTFVYVAISLGVYAYRLRVFELERRAAKAEAEAAARTRVARLLVAAGDLANSPLQTIELSIPLLRAAGGVPEAVLARIQRASERLRSVSNVLGRYDAHAGKGREGLSLDALAILEEAVDEGDIPVEPEPRSRRGRRA